MVGIGGFLQDGFNLYFPVLLLLLTTATYFSLGSRLLSVLGFQQFLEQAETTGELVEEGKELARREKRRRERLGEPGPGDRAEQGRGREDQPLPRTSASPRYTDASPPPQPTSRSPPRNIFDDL